MATFVRKDGLTRFWCPGCDDLHQVSESWDVREFAGKLTIQPSVLVLYGNQPGDKRCHSFVTDGQIQYLQDCTHELAGGSVEMDEIPEWAQA